MRHFLSCQICATVAVACLTPIGAAIAAPGHGGGVAHAGRTMRAAPFVRQGARWAPGRSRFLFANSSFGRRNGLDFGRDRPVPSYPGIYGGPGAVPFYPGTYGGRSGAFGHGGYDRYGSQGGALYADAWPGVAAPAPELAPSTYPGLPGMPVALGIGEAPAAPPQIIVINGETGSDRSSLNRPRQTRSPSFSPPSGAGYEGRGVVSAGPRIIRVTVPQG